MILNFDRGFGQTPEQMIQSLMESTQMALDTMERKLSEAGLNISSDGGNTSLLDAVYPVGSIYISVSETSPANIFGGTWEAIHGRFLVAEGNNGATGNQALELEAGAQGGETNHTLTVDEMPSHTHVQNQHRHTLATNWSSGSGSDEAYTMSNNRNAGATRYTNYVTPTNQKTGGGGSHNNLPPYLSVYMWKRTA